MYAARLRGRVWGPRREGERVMAAWWVDERSGTFTARSFGDTIQGAGTGE